MTEPLSVAFQRRAIREAVIDEWWRTNRPFDMRLIEDKTLIGDKSVMADLIRYGARRVRKVEVVASSSWLQVGDALSDDDQPIKDEAAGPCAAIVYLGGKSGGPTEHRYELRLTPEDVVSLVENLLLQCVKTSGEGLLARSIAKAVAAVCRDALGLTKRKKRKKARAS